MPGEVTLDDVAQDAGVSRATASRALNGRPGVKADVRARIKSSARNLGYRPNRAARNLAGGRASVIGLVIGSDQLADTPYQAAILQHVANEADQRDEGLMLLMESSKPSEAVRRLLADGLVDGVIVSVVALGPQWVEELLDARVPTVLIGFHPQRSDVAVVEVENLESSAELVGNMIDGGCKRVGTMTGQLARIDGVDRLAGYRLAHERRSIPVDETLIVGGDFRRKTGYELADQLLDNGVDGIFAANDEMATGIYLRAMERGLRIPEDLSLAGFDGHLTRRRKLSLATHQPLLTSVVQPFQELAAAAVEALLEAIANDDRPENRIITPHIFHGDTTR